MTPFDKKYQKLLQSIMDHGIEELNERTKHGVKALPGQTLEIEAGEGFPLLTLRKIPVKAFIAEQIWFLTGSRRPKEFLTKYTKIWDLFTNFDGVISTAYGYRWRHHFGRDQIELLIKLLEKEPSSRHAVVVTWDPASDGLSSTFKKANIPCPYTFTINIIGGQLHMHNIVRSNDMILGCPMDIAGFALLQRILAARLGVKVGKYTHSISNAHIYDNHYEAAKELISRKNQHPMIEIECQKNYYERATKGDDQLLIDLAGQFETQYQPDAAIKGLVIAV